MRNGCLVTSGVCERVHRYDEHERIGECTHGPENGMWTMLRRPFLKNIYCSSHRIFPGFECGGSGGARRNEYCPHASAFRLVATSPRSICKLLIDNHFLKDQYRISNSLHSLTFRYIAVPILMAMMKASRFPYHHPSQNWGRYNQPQTLSRLSIKRPLRLHEKREVRSRPLPSGNLI